MVFVKVAAKLAAILVVTAIVGTHVISEGGGRTASRHARKMTGKPPQDYVAAMESWIAKVRCQDGTQHPVGPQADTEKAASAARSIHKVDAGHRPEPTATHSEAPAQAAQPFSNCIIITLKRDTVRVAHVRNQTVNDFPGATIQWAIDGKDVSDDQIEEWQEEGYLSDHLVGFMDPMKPIGKPKISCLMSHVRVWEQLTLEPDEDAFYLVLEDDTFPSADFHTRYTQVLAELQCLTWDWVYLAIHPTWKRGNTKTIPGKQFINHAPRMVGNAGYLISKRGARKLLKRMLPCQDPKDQAIRKLVMAGEIEGYIVKKELIGVMGQQGRGFNRSLSNDPTRVFASNIWDK
eukprot:m.172769 g.172769  ORF g.172769 m.172769 type:complete len:347 (+) comp13581_c0_seq1:233-1273(+)